MSIRRWRRGRVAARTAKKFMVVAVFGENMITSEDKKFEFRDGLVLSRTVVTVGSECVVSK